MTMSQSGGESTNRQELRAMETRFMLQSCRGNRQRDVLLPPHQLGAIACTAGTGLQLPEGKHTGS